MSPSRLRLTRAVVAKASSFRTEGSERVCATVPVYGFRRSERSTMTTRLSANPSPNAAVSPAPAT